MQTKHKVQHNEVLSCTLYFKSSITNYLKGFWGFGVLGELGLVGGGAVSSGRSWWALGDAGAWLGVFKVCRGSSGGLGERIGCRWLVEWW